MTQATTATLDASLKQLLAQDVFTGMGLDGLDDAERAELMATMVETIKDRVLARVLDTLSTDEREELVRLTNTGSAEAVSAFVAEHVPNLDALMTQEAIQYKAEMVQNAAHIRQLLGEHPEGEPGQSHPPGDAGDTVISNVERDPDLDIDGDGISHSARNDEHSSSLPATVPDDLPIPYTPPTLPATQDEAPPTI